MEFDEIVVKESPGLCRCCLSEGCYKDMGTEYAWMSETEVYAEMLLECFDISISQLNDGPNGPNRLICEVCITRLRDACYFKKQVLDSEKKFVDMVGRGDFRPKAVLLYQSNMKTESGEELQVSLEMDDGGEVEYLEDEIDYVDDTPKLEGPQEPEPTVSDVTADPLPIRGKRGRPRKTPAKPEKKKVKVETTKAKSSKALVKGRRSEMSLNRQTEHARVLKDCSVRIDASFEPQFDYRVSDKDSWGINGLEKRQLSATTSQTLIKDSPPQTLDNQKHKPMRTLRSHRKLERLTSQTTSKPNRRLQKHLRLSNVGARVSFDSDNEDTESIVDDSRICILRHMKSAMRRTRLGKMT